MKRRNFIKNLALTAASTAAAPAIASAKSKFTFTMVTSWPPAYPILQEGPERFARRVEKASAGRLKIKVFAAGELIPALAVFDAVSLGSVEMGVSYPSYWAGKSAAAQIFAGVPFGMNAQQTQAWLTAEGYKLWQEVYQPFDLIPMSMGFTGMQMSGWYNKEIKAVEDLKGLKIRVPGLGGKVMARAGANVVLMPGSELYTALERGVIDATDWVGPYLDQRLGLDRISKYYYAPGWNEPGAHLELTINKKAWNSLPEDLQEIIRAESQEATSWILSMLDYQNSHALEKLKQNSKLEIKILPEAVLKKLHTYAKEVLKELSDKDPIFAKVYTSYNNFQKKAVNWFALGENAYARALKEAS